MESLWSHDLTGCLSNYTKSAASHASRASGGRRKKGRGHASEHCTPFPAEEESDEEDGVGGEGEDGEEESSYTYGEDGERIKHNQQQPHERQQQRHPHSPNRELIAVLRRRYGDHDWTRTGRVAALAARDKRKLQRPLFYRDRLQLNHRTAKYALETTCCGVVFGVWCFESTP
jgi:hypothetical protein